MKKLFIFTVCALVLSVNILSSDIPLLVNRDNPLPEDYVPENLVPVKSTRKDGREMQYLCKEAADALEEMLSDAENNGICGLSVTSAYRSYEMQKSLYNRTKDKRYIAYPGCSEHQSGLACDIHNLPYASVEFHRTKEYAYINDNAHRFGFIVRYPKNKEDITGIAFEPWHLRYVGKETAAFIKKRGICLEEYFR